MKKPLYKNILPWYFAGAGVLIFIFVTLLHFWSVYTQLKRHLYLDASQTLSFVEARFVAYEETLSLLKNPPDYLKNPAWLIDEFQSQPFLYGVLIWRGRYVILNSFPHARRIPKEILEYAKRGFEENGLFYLRGEVQIKEGTLVDVLVAIDTSFRTRMWRRTLIHGSIILGSGFVFMFFLGNMLARLLRREREMMLKLADTEKLAAIGRLSAMLAHEIRNPLNTLSMGLQYLKELSQARAELIGKMQREVHRLDEMVYELLQVARGIEVRLEKVRATQLLKEIEEEFSSLAEARGVDFRIEVDNSLFLEVDPFWFSRALSNIIRNALEAVEDNKGEIKVSVWERKEKSEVVFEVIDNGSGIPQTHVSNITRPFYSTKKQGFGLGLYLAEMVAKAHNGVLIIETGARSGTKISMVIKSCDKKETAK